MTELLFGATVVFVMYVLYEVFKTVSQPESTTPPTAKPAPAPQVQAAPKATEPAPSVAEPVATAAEPSADEAASKSDSSPENDHAVQLRNPATGELAAVPTNYRFAKKWIKEALVAEGLLDRVYKPGELDGDASHKVKAALEKFRSLEKYQA